MEQHFSASRRFQELIKSNFFFFIRENDVAVTVSNYVMPSHIISEQVTLISV